MAVMAVASCVEATVLPRTVVVSQCEFYPLREQPRGYLGRYVDQPLFLNPDLPVDADRTGISAHPNWGDFHSQADWEGAQRLGAEYGLDGFSFFPANHRLRFWRAIEESTVHGFLSIPVVTFNLRRLDEDIDAIGMAIKSKGGYRYGGKTLILSYWTDRANTPSQLRDKLDIARRRYGDCFLYVTDITSICNVDEFLQKGEFSTQTIERNKGVLREYLRVSDGIYVGDTFSFIKFDRGDRLFDPRLYATVVDEMKSVLSEPEFKGRKLLALSALMAHENATVQFWTPRGDGMRTLLESMRVAMEAKPDILVLAEWDEFNENTSFCPTLYNGLTTKRVVRHMVAKLHGEEQTPLAGDDLAVPNLMISYRKTVSPGERFFVDVLNVPDGARSGKLSCAVDLLDDKGEILRSYAWKELDEESLASVRFEAASEELSVQTRTVGVRLRWRKGDLSGRIDDGLHHVDMLPGSGWNLREVRQALRDIAPMRLADISYRNGIIKANLACDEPIRYAMVSGNGWIQYVSGDATSAANRFREDESNAVFKIDGYSRKRIDGDFAYRVEGVEDAEWFDWHGVVTGRTFRTDWVYSIGEPVYLRFPKRQLGSALLKLDFGNVCQEIMPLAKAYEIGAYAVGSSGAMFSAVRFARQSRYPSALNAKECSFAVRMDPDSRSMAYNVQIVTMSGKTWRSHAYVDEAKDGVACMKVYSVQKDAVAEIQLPAARVPVAAYDFSGCAGLYVPTMDRYRRLSTTLGGPCSIVSLWNRCSTSKNDVPEGTKFGNAVNSVPRRVTHSDAGHELEFDGVDDFVTFPWELIPRSAGFMLAFDMLPDAVDGKIAILSSKNLFSLWMEKGELVVRYSTNQPVHTGLSVRMREWNHVRIVFDCERMCFVVNGKSAHVDAHAPAAMSSSVVFALPNRSGFAPFRGRMRNFTVDHALSRK